MTIPLPRAGAAQRPTPRDDAALLVDALRRHGPPAGRRHTDRRDATLLTGATGFLGRRLLRELLRANEAPIICLVRAADDAMARDRVVHALVESASPEDAARIDVPAWAAKLVGGRVRAYAARLEQPALGLADEVFAALAGQVDTVLHAAAEVNWIKGYRRLRDSNVLATAGVVRFCLEAGVRRLQFVSTLAVCFSRLAPELVDERADPLDWAAGMPLAYAQSKAVAERLLRHAAERGLSVTIVRPGLLCGDTRTGASNPDDIVTALLATCVRLGAAPDVDWIFESLPVDYAARAIVALGDRQRSGLKIRHLRHERPRHWRELVLWLKLSGYPVEFLPVSSWLDRVFGAGSERREGAAALPLSSFRRFFVGTPGERDGGMRPFELYLSDRQRTIASRCTERLLARLALPMPALDGTLLRRYFNHFEASGVLPATRAGVVPPPRAAVPPALARCVAQTLTGDASQALGWTPLPFDARDGLLAEMACARSADAYGLRRYCLQAGGDSTRRRAAGGPPRPCADVVVKLKPRDRQLVDAVIAAVELLDAERAQVLRANPSVFGFARSHVREAQVHALAPAMVRRYLPRCLGSSKPEADDDGQPWGLVIEYLPDGTSRWSRRRGWGWSRADRQAVIAAMTELHGAWQPAATRPAVQSALRDPIDAGAIEHLRPAWQALAQLAVESWLRLAGPGLAALHCELVDGVRDWWHELAALPRTVVHNDFNPRNLVLRRATAAGEGAHVRVLDWELAMAGPPQQDLAELLCYVWPDGEGEAAFWADVDTHRRGYVGSTGESIDGEQWRRGLELAMRRLLVQRLALYAIADRFQRQPYLPELLRNWQRLYRWIRPQPG